MLRTRFHLIPTYDTPTEADTTWHPNNDPNDPGNTKTEQTLVANCGPSKNCQTAPPHSQTAERQSRPGLPGAVWLVRLIIMHIHCPVPYPRVRGAWPMCTAFMNAVMSHTA